jgi:hypothetical protein
VTAVLSPDSDLEHRWALDEARRLLGLHRRRPPSIPLREVIRAGPPPRAVLSYGLGVDSSAVAAKLLTDPSSRDFALDELVVITAGTGQEWPGTMDLVSQHMLPLLARHRVRYIQVARRGPAEADGVDVTADSRQPDQLHLVGSWTLADEMFDAGTVPQTCGDRICSQHFKGFALDTVIGAITRGHPFRHLVGFSADERSRAKRDTRYNTELRTGEYPLIDWGWDRTRALRFLDETFSEKWIKSACSYCPFALATEAGRAATVAQFVADPHAGLLALAMEFTATCLNPTQGLIKGQRLLTVLKASPDTTVVLALFEEYLASVPWAVYEVRRTYSPRSDGRFNHARAVKILETGTRPAMRARLRARAHGARLAVTIGDSRFADDQHPRVWLRRREPIAPAAARVPIVDAEHFLTVAPCTAVTKTGPAFPRAWAEAAQLPLAI